MALTSKGSALSSAANNIVNLSSKSRGSATRLMDEHKSLGYFLEANNFRLSRADFPKSREVKAISNINVTNTFGSLGGLIQGLYGKKMDIGGFVRGVFTGKGNKIGRPIKTASSTIRPRPTLSGGKISLSGNRAIGVSNSIFAGLDYSTGLSGNQITGAAGAAASGSLAGSLLSGAIGRSLVPVQGLGFILAGATGLAAGGLLAAGMGAFSNPVANARRQQERKLEEGKSRGGDGRMSEVSRREMNNKQKSILDSFSGAANKFQTFVKDLLDGKLTLGETPPMEDTSNQAGSTPQTSDGEIVTAEGGEVPGAPDSPYGWRGSRMHKGNDYFKPVGTPISVVSGGVVTVSDMNYDPGGWGALIEIKHQNGSISRYAHLSKINVPVGSLVSPGQVIGETGGARGARGAGNSEGPHLHFEYFPPGSTSQVDPTSAAPSIFRFGGNVRVTSARPMDSAVSPLASTELRPGSTVSTAFGRQSSMPTANIPITKKDNIRGYIVVPGHITGGGAEGERAAVEKVAINVVNKIKAMFPTAQVILWNHRNYGDSTPELSREMEDLKKLEKQGWEIIELHFDAPGGTGRGIILPYNRGNVNPLESHLAGIRGVYPQRWGEGGLGGPLLAGPKRGISLFELGNMTEQLNAAINSGDQRAIDYFSRDVILAFKYLASTGQLPGVSANQARGQAQAAPTAAAAPRPSQTGNLNINYQTSYNAPSQVIIINRPTVTMVPIGGKSGTPQIVPIPVGGGGGNVGGSVVVSSNTNIMSVLNKIQEYRLV